MRWALARAAGEGEEDIALCTFSLKELCLKTQIQTHAASCLPFIWFLPKFAMLCLFCLLLAFWGKFLIMLIFVNVGALVSWWFWYWFWFWFWYLSAPVSWSCEQLTDWWTKCSSEGEANFILGQQCTLTTAKYKDEIQGNTKKKYKEIQRRNTRKYKVLVRRGGQFYSRTTMHLDNCKIQR